jgi:hypothetical protein
VGFEEDAIYSLIQRATDEHRVRSAFTRDSIRGWIYVEADMNPELNPLRKTTTRIIQTRQTVVHHVVDCSDWIKLLTMQVPTAVVEVGQWIQVRKRSGLASSPHPKGLTNLILFTMYSY